jgi:hypothetical protein
LLHSSHPLFASKLFRISVSLDDRFGPKSRVQEEWLEFEVKVEVELVLLGESYSLIVILVSDVAEWA